MNSKEKVFIILTPGFASTETDTMCLPMQQAFVKSFAELFPGISTMVLSFHYPFFRKTYQWFGISVTSFNGRNKGGLAGILLRKKIERALERLHKKKQIIGLLSFWLGECAFVGKRFADRNGLKHYSWLSGQDARAQNKYPQRLSVKGDEIIALSDFLQEEFERNYGIRPFAVIPPGIEEGRLSSAPRDIHLLGAGSLIALKQWEVFVEAVAAIKKRMPAIKAVLAGEGPEKGKLVKLIAALDVDDNIELTGSVDHEEVLGLMQRTKILLHPSSYEGFSGVCQEALANGAHVISFCRAMNAEIEQWHIVQSRNGMVKTALAILQDESTAYKNIRFQSMAATAKQMMSKFPLSP